jgi:hypothetical protein
VAAYSRGAPLGHDDATAPVSRRCGFLPPVLRCVHAVPAAYWTTRSLRPTLSWRVI